MKTLARSIVLLLLFIGFVTVPWILAKLVLYIDTKVDFLTNLDPRIVDSYFLLWGHGVGYLAALIFCTVALGFVIWSLSEVGTDLWNITKQIIK